MYVICYKSCIQYMTTGLLLKRRTCSCLILTVKNINLMSCLQTLVPFILKSDIIVKSTLDCAFLFLYFLLIVLFNHLICFFLIGSIRRRPSLISLGSSVLRLVSSWWRLVLFFIRVLISETAGT